MKDDKSKPQNPIVKNLIAQIDVDNLALNMDPTVLNDIGARVVRDYNNDVESRSDWERQIQTAQDLAKLLEEKKDTPWENAANVKYPIVAQSSIQFAARAYPTIIKDDQVVKGKVIGADPEGKKAARAKRIGEHMSFQLLEQMEGWEPDFDKMLVLLPVLGSVFRKSYFDADEELNVSEYCNPQDVVINYWAKSLEKTQRITHVYELFPHEIEERKRSEVFLDVDLGRGDQEAKQAESTDEDNPFIILEQHRRWDLDDDGYAEPYIITVHKTTMKVLRIKARYDEDGIIVHPKTKKLVKIKPVQYFTKYDFLPSPEGSIYGMGFGILLGHTNKIVNSTINQLLDAGTLANTGGGLINASIAGSKRGKVRITPGQFTEITYSGDDITKVIAPFKFQQPSIVMLKLLGLMIDAGEKLGSQADILSGQQPGANVPATSVLALIEQGLQVFTSILKRIHVSLREEFRKIRRLNKIYLDDTSYFTVLDEIYTIAKADYDDTDCDVVPVSNPKDVTDIQKILKAEMLKDLTGQGLNDREIIKRYLEALQIEDVEKLLPDETAKPETDPQVEIELGKLQMEKDKLDLEDRKVAILEKKLEPEIAKLKADAIKAIADAENTEIGQQFEAYRLRLEVLEKSINAAQAAAEIEEKSKAAAVPGEASPEAGQPESAKQLELGAKPERPKEALVPALDIGRAEE